MHMRASICPSGTDYFISIIHHSLIRPIAVQESNHPHCKQVVGPHYAVMTVIM